MKRVGRRTIIVSYILFTFAVLACAEETDLSKRIFLKLDIPKRKFYTNERIPVSLK